MQLPTKSVIIALNLVMVNVTPEGPDYNEKSLKSNN